MPTTSRKQNSLVLLALVVLFVGPVIAAFVWNVLAPGWVPFGRTNHGALIEPARHLDSDAILRADGQSDGASLEGVWTLAYVAYEDCDSVCQLSLLEVRQARLALGKDMDRVRRLLLLPAGDEAALRRASAAQAGVKVARIGPGWQRALAGSVPGDRGYLLLVDPQAHAVLRYEGKVEGGSVLADLKRLLRISKIG